MRVSELENILQFAEIVLCRLRCVLANNLIFSFRAGENKTPPECGQSSAILKGHFRLGRTTVCRALLTKGRLLIGAGEWRYI